MDSPMVIARSSMYRGGHAGQHSLGQVIGGRLVGHVSQQDGELVPTESGQVVTDSQGGAEAVGHLNQDLVANVVAVGVVDGLEGVEVAEGHRQFSLSDGQGLGQPFAERCPVGYAGQPVVSGDVNQALMLDPFLDGQLGVASLRIEAHLVPEQWRAGEPPPDRQHGGRKVATDGQWNTPYPGKPRLLGGNPGPWWQVLEGGVDLLVGEGGPVPRALGAGSARS